MKNLSVKARVAIWYGAFLVIIVAIVFAAIIFASDRVVQEDIKQDLEEVVSQNAERVTIKNGKLDISDKMENYQDGIYILVYEDGNFLITGVAPDSYPTGTEFKANTVQKVESNGESYYIYDKPISNEGYVGIWVRGITLADMSVSDPAISVMIKAFLFGLPLLIFIAIFGGYRITRRAFRPAAQVAETAEKIGSGKDLSKRIHLHDEYSDKDEIYLVAHTFNEMLDRLESSFDSEKQFANDASHELRTPISVIMSQCEYALETAKTPEELQSSLEVIFKQTKKMSSLISQLLTLARADKGFEKLQIEELDISMLLEMICDEMKENARARNIQIETSIEPGLICSVDQTMMTRLFINLVSNAIRYGKENGHIQVSMKRESLPDTDAKQLVCKVSDDGIGISADDLPKIWNRFYQVNPSRNTEYSNNEYSVGLGLSMVKWIAEAHGGDITAESVLGEGSVFTFTLPL